jgi:putative transposase
MKAHSLLLVRHAGGAERRHDGRIAVPERNTRWCSDGFEIACGPKATTGHNSERVRVAFALDCCDREAMSFVGTTGGISVDDVHDLMVAAVEQRFGRVNRLPRPIEWRSDNGSPYVARDTRTFARDIGLLPKTTPLESPQSNGMAEAFVRTFKRDYVRVGDCADAQTVLRSLPAWFTHYNEVHPIAPWDKGPQGSSSVPSSQPDLLDLSGATTRGSFLRSSRPAGPLTATAR